ncbi:hypothetical protein [Flavobacterium crassostreae]|uniref:hypothetical protein n=1 Tax=Flavobacterium crassostreae TaxID=1763534 RepID=UPI0012FE0304|nr:hypothetical protein [Flavobacterium crassostreae]
MRNHRHGKQLDTKSENKTHIPKFLNYGKTATIYLSKLIITYINQKKWTDN